MSINTLSLNPPLSEPAAQGAELELGKKSFKIPENWAIVDAPKIKYETRYNLENIIAKGELGKKFVAYAEQFTGKGILDNDGYYSQILPYEVYVQAVYNFNQFDDNCGYKQCYLSLLDQYSSDPIATSAIFAIIAYGHEFAKNLISEDNIKNLQYSLDNSKTFFENRINLQQNYLNTCVAVSNFSALSDLLHNNIFVLNKIVEFELGKINTKVSFTENLDGHPLDKRAYNTVNPIAPTIRNEIAKHIKQCENKVNNVNKFFGNPEKVLNRKILIEYQNGLVEAFERMAAIQNPLEPVLISKRFFQSFILSCIVDVILIFLAKIFTFGLYTGSIKLSERVEGVQPIQNDVISILKSLRGNFSEFDINFWRKIYNSGIALTAKDLGICTHCIAIKACIDTNNKKYFEIHDPLEKNFSRVYISQDNIKNIVTDYPNMV